MRAKGESATDFVSPSPVLVDDGDFPVVLRDDCTVNRRIIVIAVQRKGWGITARHFRDVDVGTNEVSVDDLVGVERPFENNGSSQAWGPTITEWVIEFDDEKLVVEVGGPLAVMYLDEMWVFFFSLKHVKSHARPIRRTHVHCVVGEIDGISRESGVGGTG